MAMTMLEARNVASSKAAQHCGEWVKVLSKPTDGMPEVERALLRKAFLDLKHQLGRWSR